MGEKIKIDKKYLRKPDVAWPTLLVLLAGWIIWASAIYLRLWLSLNCIITIPISVLGCYVLFTPLHDAAHASISGKYKWLNETIGNIAGIPFFFAPFKLFQMIHLKHHAYTNIPGKDPDYWSGQPSRFRLLLCSTQILYYMWMFIKIVLETLTSRYMETRKGKGMIPKNLEELYEFTSHKVVKNYVFVTVYGLFCMFLNWAIFIYYSMNGEFMNLFTLWVLPSEISITLLSYLFDYLPHAPHSHDENKYKLTNMTDGIFNGNSGNGSELVSMLTFNQLSYHNVHHKYPFLPFYMYNTVWHNYKDEFIQRGTPVVTLLGDKKNK